MEIKFRVWDRYRQAFLDPSQVWARLDFSDIYVTEDPSVYTDINPSFQWKDIQQYIGQKDNEGNDVYEGDILLCHDDVYVVRWSRTYSGLQFCAVRMNGTLIDVHGGIPSSRKIIGNIFETPYLMEEVKKEDDEKVDKEPPIKGDF